MEIKKGMRVFVKNLEGTGNGNAYNQCKGTVIHVTENQLIGRLPILVELDGYIRLGPVGFSSYNLEILTDEHGRPVNRGFPFRSTGKGIEVDLGDRKGVWNGIVFNGVVVDELDSHWVQTNDKGEIVKLENRDGNWYVKGDEEVSTVHKFKVGDRVVCVDETDRRYGQTGTVVNRDNSQIPYQVDFSGYLHWQHTQDIELIRPAKEVNPIKMVKNLVTRLLDPDKALIAEHVMNSDGTLDMDNPLVQQALLNTDGFQKNLIELIKAEQAEKEKKK